MTSPREVDLALAPHGRLMPRSGNAGRLPVETMHLVRIRRSGLAKGQSSRCRLGDRGVSQPVSENTSRCSGEVLKRGVIVDNSHA